jgi:hypothetical protein
VVNFYRRFVPAAVKILRPVTDSLKGSPKAATPVDWTGEMEKAFARHLLYAKLPCQLTLGRVGSWHSWSTPLQTTWEHAALQQRASPSSAWQPLAFFSKKLEPAQVRYSVLTENCWHAV